MTWQPIVLLGFAGLLLGGVFATWKDSRVLAAVLAVLAAALAVGGVLWVLGE
jgi:hypothetical protein